MMAASATPHINATDRLGLTLFFAVVLHAVLILGVTFVTLKREPKNPPQRMEITLVKSKSDPTPDKADYLAQATQQGSGNPDDASKPQSPEQRRIMQDANTEGNAPQTEIVTQQARAPQPTPTTPALTARQSTQQLAVQEQPHKQDAQRPTAGELISRSLQIASASAEVQQRQQAYKNRKRHKYITASTQAYKYAAYQEAWRQKVERFGRLNFPDEARRRQLSGSLTLTVAIRADGTVQSMTVDKSSGVKLLDDAAKRIVRLASPFSPLPENIREETDILHITRSWIFYNGSSFYSN